MEALLTQGDSENFKSRFNSAFLAGSDYSLLPRDTSLQKRLKMRAFEINSYTTMTPILTATQENEGVGTVSQVKIRQKNRTRKALNIAV